MQSKDNLGTLNDIDICNWIKAGEHFDMRGFEKRKRPLASNDSFQQTLIYSGKVGDKINIGYREFSGNLARPAFNNNVEYDLSDSMLIAYKGARIEVLEANNQFIKYRVIENFNKAIP